jgi:hypothetical protein
LKRLVLARNGPTSRIVVRRRRHPHITTAVTKNTTIVASTIVLRQQLGVGDVLLAVFVCKRVHHHHHHQLSLVRINLQSWGKQAVCPRMVQNPSCQTQEMKTETSFGLFAPGTFLSRFDFIGFPRKMKTTMKTSGRIRWRGRTIVMAFIWILCMLMFLSIHMTEALPLMILTSTRSKCMSVIAPQGQVISIEYYAPGTISEMKRIFLLQHL